MLTEQAITFKLNFKEGADYDQSLEISGDGLYLEEVVEIQVDDES